MAPMLGFKRFFNARRVLSGVELGVTCLFVRYCTLRSHLLNEESGRGSTAVSRAVASCGMRGFGW